MKPKMYPGLFASITTARTGRDWMRRMDSETRRIFSEIGRMHNQHGHSGGLRRAETAARDPRGRFTKTTKES